MAALESPAERVQLLQAGHTGKQVEQLYIQKNGFTVIGVSWVE